MNLTKCPDCEKEISLRVKLCPNCGRCGKRYGWRIAGLMLSAFLFAIGIWMMRSMDSYIYNEWSQIATGFITIGFISFWVFVYFIFNFVSRRV